MVALHEFEHLQRLSGAPFDVDACCNSTGNNALCNQFYSDKASFLTANVSGQHIWLNAPFRYLSEFIQHYLDNKARKPLTTSACILVPAWNKDSPWRPLLQGMQLLHVYPVGTQLFTMPTKQGSRVLMQGIPWPVEVWFDAKGTQSPALRVLSPEKSVSDTHLGQVGGKSAPVMTFDVKINGAEGTALTDSGATGCFADSDFVEEHGIVLQETSRPVHLADGTIVVATHQCTLTIWIQNFKTTVTCLVISLDRKFSVILGDNWLEQHKAKLDFSSKTLQVYKKGKLLSLFPRENEETEDANPQGFTLLSNVQVNRALKRGYRHFMINVIDDGVTPVPIVPSTSPKVAALLEKYKIVFRENNGLPPERNIGHTIRTEPGAKPPFRPMYRLSPLELAEVERQVKALLAEGLIEPSSSPYGAPILFVNKPDGSLRLCLDYRKLNSLTEKNRYPLPRIDQLMDQLRSAKVFSSMDLQSGYHQIRISPEDVPKTAFRTPFGHYQFKVLSFGLTNAPATFQNVMNDIFREQLGKFVLVYIDDIVIFSSSPEEHLAHLECVLQILQKEKLFARLRKCHFEKSEIKFLGHLVGTEGIKVDPAKISVVKDWPVPRNLRQVQSFLGLATYFRKFIQGFSNLVAPLTALSKKGLVWTDWPPDSACQKSFDGTKHALTHAPTLAMPDFEKPFEVIADASKDGIGAILLQEGHPIAFESRRMIPAEKNYITTEQELLAVVHGIKVFRCYLEGVDFTMITDHCPNTFLQTQPTLSRRHARWSEYLQRYRFKWEYRAGRDNVADPLSRHPSFADSLTAILCSMTTPFLAVTTRSKTAVVPPLVHEDVPLVLPGPAPKKVRRSPAVVPLPQPAPVPSSPAVGPSMDELTQLKTGYSLDAWFNNQLNLKGLVRKDGLWWKGAQLVIPNIPLVKEGILWELHDAPYSGHMGTAKTLEAVSRLYWWPGMTTDVTRYVHTCHTCQRNKASNQVPAGLLKPLQIPQRYWESVGMDYVVQLPVTKRGHDAILVFVDRLSKMVHLVPTTTTVTGVGTAQLYFDTVWKLHGIPKDIVSDRDTRFTGHFWRELMRLIGTKQYMSTSFHPQSDGQTERVNRVMEDMLRHYVGAAHDDWDNCLAAAEFAINNSYHESTQSTPFRLVYGADPILPLSIGRESKVRSAQEFADKMSEGLTTAKKAIEAAQQRQKRYADERRRDVAYAPGDMVLLSSKNINLKTPGIWVTPELKKAHGSKKLMPKWIGPFAIVKAINSVAYRVELPDSLPIHDVFHVSVLKPYRSDGRTHPPPLPEVLDGVEYFTIDRLLDHRVRKRGRKTSYQYLVKWLGYGPEYDSWEPEESVAASEMGETLRRYKEYAGISPPA